MKNDYSSKNENNQPQSLPLAVAVPVAVGSEQDDPIHTTFVEYATMINNEEEQTPLQMSAMLYLQAMVQRNLSALLFLVPKLHKHCRIIVIHISISYCTWT